MHLSVKYFSTFHLDLRLFKQIFQIYKLGNFSCLLSYKCVCRKPSYLVYLPEDQNFVADGQRLLQDFE